MLAVHDGPAMHTKPFVPLTAVSQPLGVSTKTDASFEMPPGAALRASAIAAFRSIKYCESGSIFGSLFPTPQGHPYLTTVEPSELFFSPGWVLCFSASPRDAAKPTLPQLNLHNTRVRRKPSGFLQVAVSNARNPTVLMWASCPLARPIQP